MVDASHSYNLPTRKGVDMSELLSIDDAAKALMVNRTTILRLLSAGVLEGVQVGARKILRAHELRAFVEMTCGEQVVELAQKLKNLGSPHAALYEQLLHSIEVQDGTQG